MIKLYEEKGNCCGCTACMNICPRGSITMEKDEEGFAYPVIDRNTCTSCGACKEVCAFHKKNYEEKIPAGQKVYAQKHKDKEIRMKSSSGGAFSALSESVLNQGGVVYGAVFNDCFQVVHAKADGQETRDKMRGSKYVQSGLGDIFKEIRAELKKGTKVLFTGTPCQNGGLKSYLKQEYPNLILCDIACHGVTSPMLWEDYKTFLEENHQSKIQEVNFRNKDAGWRNTSLKVSFDKGVYRKSMQEDPYYILFFSHYSIRPSCHQCVYTSYHRVSDITLADFWGIENSHRAFQDDIGITLVLANTEKGRKLLEETKAVTDLIESSHEAFYQPIFEMPSKASPKRQEFWRVYRNKGYGAAFKSYGRLSLTQWVIKKIGVPLLKKTGLYNLISKVYFK